MEFGLCNDKSCKVCVNVEYHPNHDDCFMVYVQLYIPKLYMYFEFAKKQKNRCKAQAYEFSFQIEIELE